MKAVIAAALLVVLAMTPVTAQAAGSLQGSWSGSGTIAAITGKTETARCNIRYTKTGPSDYTMDASCASTSGKATQSGLVRPTGAGTYAGTFHNAQYNARGSVTIRLSGNRQTIEMHSDKGTAKLTLSKR